MSGPMPTKGTTELEIDPEELAKMSQEEIQGMMNDMVPRGISGNIISDEEASARVQKHERKVKQHLYRKKKQQDASRRKEKNRRKASSRQRRG